MRNRVTRWNLFLTAAICLACAPSRAQTDPASLPAHDTHQAVNIAADPYISAARYKEKFGKHTPYDGGILAVEIFVRNDNDKPIHIDLSTVSLLVNEPGQSRQDLGALAPEEVADRVLRKDARDVRAQRLPLPLPGRVLKTGKGKEWDEFYGTLRADAMSTDILPPDATVHGFFYFDVDHHYDWLSHARIELPDLEFMLDKKALFFFEIDLAPAIH